MTSITMSPEPINDRPLSPDRYVVKKIEGLKNLPTHPIDLVFPPEASDKWLGALSPSLNLRSISIIGTSISDQAMIPFLKKFPNILEIDCEACQDISDKTLRVLTGKSPLLCPKLQKINIAKCPVNGRINALQKIRPDLEINY